MFYIYHRTLNIKLCKVNKRLTASKNISRIFTNHHFDKNISRASPKMTGTA